MTEGFESGLSGQEVLDALRKAKTALQKEQYKGTYSRPSSGIPKSDLESSVQQSLNKADTALQSHQDISGLATKQELSQKVDKVEGKQLSTEDFTTTLKKSWKD